MADYLLGDIVEFIGGGTPDKSKPEYWNGPIPWASVKDIKSSHLTQTQDFISEEGLKSSTSKLIPPGTVIIATRMAVGRAAINSKSMAINQDLKALKPKVKLEPKFLLHLMLANALILNSKATGATVKGIRLEHLKGLKVSIPPFEEQKRIAGILDAAEELKQKRQKSLELINELKQSIFIEMFGDPILNSKSWPLEKLKNLTSKIGSGATPRGGSKSYKDEGIPLIRSMNVQDGLFTSKGIAYIDDGQAKALNNAQVLGSDVLLNITGASVARVCITPKEYHGARVNQHVAIIRPTSHLNCLFLQFQLINPSFKSKLLSGAGGGATREAITKSDIENTTVIHPPIEEQNKFAQRITKISQFESDYSLSFKKLDELSASLEKKAFSGELSGATA